MSNFETQLSLVSNSVFFSHKTAGGETIAVPTDLRMPLIGEFYTLARSASGEHLPVTFMGAPPPVVTLRCGDEPLPDEASQNSVVVTSPPCSGCQAGTAYTGTIPFVGTFGPVLHWSGPSTCLLYPGFTAPITVNITCLPNGNWRVVATGYSGVSGTTDVVRNDLPVTELGKFNGGPIMVTIGLGGPIECDLSLTFSG